MKYSKKIFAANTLVVALILPAMSWADCEKPEVERLLERDGYTFTHLNSAENGRNSFLISKDGGKFVVHVDRDGDVSYRRFFRNNDDYTMNDFRAVMNALKYLQVYLDSDDDIVMAYDVALWGNPRCNVDLSENLRLFINLTDNGEDILSEK